MFRKTMPAITPNFSAISFESALEIPKEIMTTSENMIARDSIEFWLCTASGEDLPIGRHGGCYSSRQCRRIGSVASPAKILLL